MLRQVLDVSVCNLRIYGLLCYNCYVHCCNHYTLRSIHSCILSLSFFTLCNPHSFLISIVFFLYPDPYIALHFFTFLCRCFHLFLKQLLYNLDTNYNEIKTESCTFSISSWIVSSMLSINLLFLFSLSLLVFLSTFSPIILFVPLSFFSLLPFLSSLFLASAL